MRATLGLLLAIAAAAACGGQAGTSGQGGPARAESELLGRASSEPLPGSFGLGHAATAAEIAALDIDIMPDGRGLPPGSGTPQQGAQVYAAKCVVCHGPEGRGPGPGGVLVGRIPGDPFDFAIADRGPRTIGNYWPWATTIFDYTRRAMPQDRLGSLTDDEVYAVTAYLLYMNQIIGENDVMNAQTLPQVVMPSRDKFVRDDRLTSNRVR